MKSLAWFLCVALLCALSLSALAEPALPPFDASGLAIGASMEYAPYTIERLGENLYHIEDGIDAYPPGFWLNEDGSYAYDENGNYMNNCADMYLIQGEEKALLIDLSNAITRDDAAQALRNIAYGLAGDLALEIAVTHGHPDHVGMASVFVGDDLPIYFPKGDYAAYMADRFGLSEDRLAYFTPGETVFELGNCPVDTVKVEGHTAFSTVFVLREDNVLISGDAIGSGGGVWIWGEAGLRSFASGMENLMTYLRAAFTEDDLNAMRIYSGHAWQYGKFVEGGAEYLDWQYVQDMKKCIDLVGQGAWFDPGSGLTHTVWASPINTLDGDFIYGTAAISTGLTGACDYAGYTAGGAKRANYPWGKSLAYTDFISPGSTYPRGEYFDLYEERTYASDDPAVGEMTYYVYDPVAHGADPNGEYPVLFWLHGSGNALDGKLAIAYGGAELYASPEYQALMGGPAYIICPLANETRSETGATLGNWMTRDESGVTSLYSKALKGILDTVLAENEGRTGKVIVSGTSAGGYGAWRFILDHTDAVDACLLMAAAYLPTDEDLDKIDKAGIRLWVTHGYYDELIPYDRYLEPAVKKLLLMENAELTLLEWVRNGDYGIASINFGIEMGQHCICAAIGGNLLYDDGTPYDISHPGGVTGWIRQIVEN